MAIERCPKVNQDCPFYNRKPPRALERSQQHGCYSDADHKYPRREMTNTLERLWGNLPHNLEQICRQEHVERNQRHAEGVVDWPDFPSREEMLGAVLLAVANEELYLSARKAERIMNG